MPPGAQYLSQTGQLPQAISWFQQQGPALTSMQQAAPAQYGPTQMPKEQEIQMLEDQATALENQLEQIRNRIQELEEKE